MKAVDPRIPLNLLPPGSRAIIAGKNQTDYERLPVIATVNHQVISRWTFTDAERRAIFEGKDLYLTVLTANGISPVRLSIGLEDWR